MLDSDIKKLAATPPPKKKGMARAADINAEIVSLENKLGIEHEHPIFSISKGNARIEHLRSILELAGGAPAAAPVTTIVPAAKATVPATPTAPAARALAATAAEFIRMDAASQAGFCAAAGTMDYAEFSLLTPALKSLFSRHGGKLTGKVQNGRSPIRSLS
jgi:hypothetical protein